MARSFAEVHDQSNGRLRRHDRRLPPLAELRVTPNHVVLSERHFEVRNRGGANRAAVHPRRLPRGARSTTATRLEA